MIETFIHYQQPRTSQNENQTRRRILPKGIYYGGNVSLVPGQLKVQISSYFSVGFDGMVSRDLLATDVGPDNGIQANLVQRIVIYAVFSPVAPPTVGVFSIAESTYAAHPNRDYMTTVCRLNIPFGATEIEESMVDLTVRDEINIGRTSWKGVYASYSGLPKPPEHDSRRGDHAVTADTLTEYVFDGEDWEQVADGGLINLRDGRAAFISSPGEIPVLEFGRRGQSTSDVVGDRAVRSLPNFDILSRCGPNDADVGLTIASRSIKKSAANVVYVKNRNAADPAAVEEDDLRIGSVADVPGFFVRVVQAGDPDIGEALSAGAIVVGQKNGLSTFAYFQPTPAGTVSVGDHRLWQMDVHNSLLGLSAGGSEVGTGEADIGDSVVASYAYSRTSPAVEIFYHGTAPGLIVVTENQYRLGSAANADYDYRSVTVRERGTGRGGAYGLYQRSTGSIPGAESGLEFDSAAADNGYLPSFRILEDGAESGWVDRSALFSMLQSLYLRRGGIDVYDLAGPSPDAAGGLAVNLNEAWYWVGGRRINNPGETVFVTNNATSYIYMGSDGAIHVTASLATATNPLTATPIAQAVASGGNITKLRSMIRVIDNLDMALPLTVGPTGMFHTLQEAIDWVTAYRAAGATLPICTIEILGVSQISDTIDLSATYGIVIRSAPVAGRSDNTGAPDNGLYWTFDGPAIDFGSSLGPYARDIWIDGVNFGFTSTSLSPSACVFYGGGTGLRVTNCTTTKLAGNTPRNKLARFWDASDTDLISCTMENCEVDVTDYGIWAQALNRCKIAHNSIRHTKPGSGGVLNYGIAGIKCNDGFDTEIIANKIHPEFVLTGNGDGFYVGIDVNTFRSVIAENVIRYSGSTSAAGACGISTWGERNQVRGNTIVWSTTEHFTAIYAQDAHYTSIRGNQLKGQTASLTAQNVIAFEVFASEPSIGTSIEGNSVTGAFHQVLYVWDGDITALTFHRNTGTVSLLDTAFRLVGPRANFSHNNFEIVGIGSPVNTIFMIDGDATATDAVIIGNYLICNNHPDGQWIIAVSVSGDGARIMGNHFEWNSDYDTDVVQMECLEVAGARTLIANNNLITSCIEQSSFDTGINLNDPTDEVRILGNFIRTSLGTGVELATSSECHVEGNRIIARYSFAPDSGKGYAIHVSTDGGEHGVIVGNNCSDTGNAGVSAQIWIEGNPADTKGVCALNIAKVQDDVGWTKTYAGTATVAPGLNVTQ